MWGITLLQVDKAMIWRRTVGPLANLVSHNFKDGVIKGGRLPITCNETENWNRKSWKKNHAHQLEACYELCFANFIQSNSERDSSNMNKVGEAEILQRKKMNLAKVPESQKTDVIDSQFSRLLLVRY